MSLSYNATEVRLITVLFKLLQENSEEESYLYKLSKYVDRSQPATMENLEKLEEKNIVKARPTGIPRGERGPVRIYTLTPYGQRFAQVLLDEHNPFVHQLLNRVRLL